MYAGNLLELAHTLRKLQKEAGVRDVEFAEELLILLESKAP